MLMKSATRSNATIEVCQNQPIISISCRALRPGELKGTVKNIIATKGFVVNLISEAWAENANACSIEFPEGISEWPASGLTRELSVSYFRCHQSSYIHYSTLDSRSSCSC